MNQCCETNTASTEKHEWTYRPDTDVLHTNDHYDVVADIPGAAEDSIDVTFEDGVLTIDARVHDRYESGTEFGRREFGVGNYHRRFGIEDDIDISAISAAYDAGVLRVRLPKAATAKARRIPIS